MSKQLQKAQTIAIHVLDEHILPLTPRPFPLGGNIEEWKDYYKKCLEIAGSGYDEEDICYAGYFVTRVEEIVGDQILFRDSYGELRLAPSDQVITQEEAPKAFEVWLLGSEDHD